MVSHLGVHRVGEVDRRCTFDEGDHATLGRKDVDLVTAEVELERFEERNGIGLFLLDVNEALHPRDLTT